MKNCKIKEETKMSEVLNVEEIFGSKVFTLGKMRERLPKSVYKEVKKIIDHGGELSLATADGPLRMVQPIIHIGFSR